MRIHTIEGRDMRDALERAQAELGGDAVVLVQEGRSGGRVALAVSDTVPPGPSALAKLRAEARALLREVESHKAAPGVADVERCLRASGASRAMIARIVGGVADNPRDGEHPLDLAAGEIAKLFPVAEARRARGTTTVIAFLGHTGVGKTTTLAKLAVRLVRAGRRVGIATLDAHRVGSVEQWRAYAQLYQLPLFVLRDAAQLAVEIERAPNLDVVLLDTTGNLTRDTDQLRRLEEVLEATESDVNLDVHLVFSAIASKASLNQIVENCSALKPAGCVITKLDETAVPAPALELALKRELPIAFLCDGPEVEQSFRRPAGDDFADLLLRGRLS